MKGKKVVVRSKREREGYPTRYNSIIIIIIIRGSRWGGGFAKKLGLLSPLLPPAPHRVTMIASSHVGITVMMMMMMLLWCGGCMVIICLASCCHTHVAIAAPFWWKRDEDEGAAWLSFVFHIPGKITLRTNNYKENDVEQLV